MYSVSDVMKKLGVSRYTILNNERMDLSCKSIDHISHVTRMLWKRSHNDGLHAFAIGFQGAPTLP